MPFNAIISLTLIKPPYHGLCDIFVFVVYVHFSSLTFFTRPIVSQRVFKLIITQSIRAYGTQPSVLGCEQNYSQLLGWAFIARISTIRRNQINKIFSNRGAERKVRISFNGFLQFLFYLWFGLPSPRRSDRNTLYTVSLMRTADGKNVYDCRPSQNDISISHR